MAHLREFLELILPAVLAAPHRFDPSNFAQGIHSRRGTPHSIQSERGQSKKEALWQLRFSIQRLFNQKLKEMR